jgi:HAD superfamily hydrolase (TIGR01509 family)
MKYNAAILDLDGVVIDTTKLWNRVNKILLEKRGKVYDEKELSPMLMSRPLLETVQMLKNHYNLLDDPIELLYERTELAKKVYEEDVTFVPGLELFIEKLKNKGVKYAIATSSTNELIEVVDQKLKLREIFDHHIYTIADVGNVVKPNPDIFLFAAKKIEVEPAATFTIVDSSNSIAASLAAGMYTIAIATTFDRWRLEEAHPNEIVNRFEQIDIDKLTTA